MILLMVGMLFSCQRPELSDSDTSPRPEGGNGEEVTLTFSALLPSSPSTKAMGDEPSFGEDIKSMHLVLFDENGMLVETREATILENGLDHDSDIKDKYGNLVPHLYEASFKVTLTVTDRPRTIHFIANCPVDQIAYGHEISIIGNLYVEKDGDSTTPETAYWARVEVPYINYKEVEVEGEKHYVPVDEIQPYFRCVPMLRNFAQVVVTDATGDTDPFRFIGFSVYNTIDIGTIAPYNNTTQKFQSFLDTDGSKYSYPELTALNYEGHALAAAELNTELPKDANGNVIFYEEYDPADPDDPKTIFYMYERKISARTDQEELWDESPPHVIVKGDYNGKTYYYKVDLVYDIVDDNGTPEDKTDDIVTDIEYYNILRNFRYQFTITEVSGKGYDTIEEAIQGSTSNNLSGSSTTSKFTNISDTKGRLWVSYTDTTLVTSDKITLKYKYVPDLGDLDSNNEPKINNALAGNGGLITLENLTGDVIKSYEVASTDITEGSWAGYREITLTINDPGNTIKEQTIAVKTNNANLGRDVRFYLRQKFPLEIECTPKVASEVGIPVELDIKLPVGLTDDLFPLDLAIEVYDMTLSPDATKNTLPVETGMSVIPLPEKENKTTFHFIKTIETRSEYDALTTVGNRKIFTTYWLTNKIDNESTIYVVNKYFNVASDSFINPKSFNGEFSKTSLSTDEIETVDYSFDIHEYIPGMTVTVTLDRLEPIASGSGLTATTTPGVYTYTVPVNSTGSQTIHLQTTETEEGTCSVTIDTDESYGYMPETDTITQVGLINTTIDRLIVSFTYTGNNRPNTNNVNSNMSISISEGEIDTNSKNTTRDGNTFTTTIRNVVISNTKQTANITISYSRTENWQTYTYSQTVTVQDLIEEPNVTLIRQ